MMVRSHRAQKRLYVENTKKVSNSILIQYKIQWIEGYATLNR